jgi:type II secretion system protein I
MRLSTAVHRPGMSLLEVLGATAIFLMSIVAIGELMSSSTDQAMDVQFRSRATRLCQSKLNEFASGIEQLNGATSGEFEEEPEWTWQADVTTETSAPNLYRVRVTVSRETQRGVIEVSMTQLIYDPLQRGQLSESAPASSGSTDPSTTGSGTSGSGGSGMTGNSGGSGMAGGPGAGASGFGGGGIGGFAGGAGGGGRPGTGAGGGRPGAGASGFGGGGIGGFAGGAGGGGRPGGASGGPGGGMVGSGGMIGGGGPKR